MKRKVIIITLLFIMILVSAYIVLGWFFEKGNQEKKISLENDNHYVGHGTSEDISKSAPHSLQGHVSSFRFSPQPGQRMTFGFDMQVEADIDLYSFLPKGMNGGHAKGSEKHVPYDVSATGELNVKYYPDREGVWTVAAALTNPSYAINGQVPMFASDLRFPFSFRITNRGEINNFQFARGTDEAAKNVIKRLIYLMQITFPEKSMTTWRSTEVDGMGRYIAVYELKGKQEDRGNKLNIVKKKVAYEKTWVTGEKVNPILDASATHIEESRAEIIVPLYGAWISSIELRERRDLSAQGNVLSKSSIRFHAWQEALLGSVVFPDTFSAFRAQLLSGRYVLQSMYATNPVLDQMGEGLSLAGALDLYMKLRQGNSAKAERSAEEFFVNYLRQYPDVSEALVRQLCNGLPGIDDVTQQILWRLIAEAGHPEAQQAMMKAALNPGYSGKTRIRAMSYVSDFQYPTNLLVNELWKNYQDIKQGDPSSMNGQLKTMSIFALGSLGFRDKLNHQIMPLIRERLLQGLQHADSSWDRRMALRAIGNYGNADILDHVEPYLKDSDANVRSAAYLALRRMEEPQAEQTLINSCSTESSPMVRRTALKTLSHMKPTNLGIGWAREEVLRAQDAKELVALVNILGKSLEEHPQNERSLRELLSTNPPRDVKMNVYSYIPPE